MSGKSNVLHWMEGHGIAASDEIAERVLHAAKNASTVLTDEELFALCRQPSPR